MIAFILNQPAFFWQVLCGNTINRASHLSDIEKEGRSAVLVFEAGVPA